MKRSNTYKQQESGGSLTTRTTDRYNTSGIRLGDNLRPFIFQNQSRVLLIFFHNEVSKNKFALFRAGRAQYNQGTTALAVFLAGLTSQQV